MVSNGCSNVVYPKQLDFFSICINEYDGAQWGNDLLNKPSFIICNAVPAMGVLCSLTVKRDKIDQSRLKRIVSY